MIITRTPYRISFFGGGSDYPDWYRKYGGRVISTSINKYIYITCRSLPKFFDHKYRIVWSKIENVKNLNKIEHKAVKNLIKLMNIKDGLEIHYDGDLPARSGIGSSSSFVVGLMKALNEFKDKKVSPINLARQAINFEQNVLKETVGSQDQIAASVGGFNKIIFQKNNQIKIKRFKSQNIKKLNDNLLLIYTSIKRDAHKVASSYVNQLNKSKKKYIEEIINHSIKGEKFLNSGNLNDFGRLLNSTWQLKKKLSNSVSNKLIDELYDYCLENGALGGKLLGAGAGGFLLIYMEKKYRNSFFLKSKKIINVPFKFAENGSEIIFNSNKI